MGMGVKTVVGRIEGMERMQRLIVRMSVSFKGMEEGGFGRRVRDEGVAHVPNVRGKKRGRPPKRDSYTDVHDGDSKRSKLTRTSNKRLRWSLDCY